MILIEHCTFLYHVGIAVVISTRLIFAVALWTIWVMDFTNLVWAVEPY